jgi:hypothetical protein
LKSEILDNQFKLCATAPFDEKKMELLNSKLQLLGLKSEVLDDQLELCATAPFDEKKMELLNSKLQLLGLKSDILDDQLELLDPQDPEDEAILHQRIRLHRSQVGSLQHLVVTPGLSLSLYPPHCLTMGLFSVPLPVSDNSPVRGMSLSPSPSLMHYKGIPPTSPSWSSCLASGHWCHQLYCSIPPRTLQPPVYLFLRRALPLLP